MNPRPQGPGATPSYTERTWKIWLFPPSEAVQGPHTDGWVEVVEASALRAEREGREKAEEALRDRHLAVDAITDAASKCADASQLRPGGQVEAYLDQVVPLLDMAAALLIPDTPEVNKQHARSSLSALPAQKGERRD